jgi:addiction module RelE/StbE family toxin
MGDRIVEEAIQLRKFVESGRVGRIAGSRELVISGTDYIIMYRIRGDTVRILRVLHGRQRWPKT